ncbi:flagellar hook-length control protein [Pseudomonas sp. M47T1]|uniref:flagellar hook-length control protein FliK n=1 Tax=unclassified Pseudomonas TaxID=196821 RepID=UPI00026083D1|nr:flagellar hook-length control protein FliK [Pseudomonas sp. M47T1]EIK93516.1 flagellar hook-length control protein [Pseudomonas sp. M47T1]
MSVASNPLLQISSAASTQASTLATLSKAAEPAKDASADFAKVYAKQSQATPTKVATVDHQQAASKQDATASQAKSKTATDKDTAASKPAVADSGKNLPAHKTAKADKSDKAGKTDNTDKADKADKGKGKDDDQDDDSVSDATTSTATDTPVVAVTTPDPTTPVAATPDPTQAQAQPTPVVDPAQTAALLQTQVPAQGATASTTDSDSFDPSKDDPLANMPTLRLALEQNAKAQGTTSAHAQTDNDASTQGAVNSDADQSFATGLAAMVVQQKGSSDGTGDKAFDSQIDDGLKNVKGATADTRIDDFANRLAAMTDAPTAKTVAATPAPVQAPTTQLAMNQSGWTEGVVNRVMYLSSQNLKSADIQLTPAELGRLSIRVDMTPDQQTAVTFTSAHLHVREALESQQGKLKDMFAEQGMGQLDVNVSDQSRQSSQDQAQQGQRTARGTRGSDSLDGVAAASPLAAEPTVQQVIVGTSAIDYYA